MPIIQTASPQCKGALGISLLVLAASGCGQSDPALRLERLAQKYNREHSTITHLTASEVAEGTNNWLIIDVRTRAERDISWIPNSIPVATFDHQPHLYTARPLLLYCTAGWRSAKKGEELIEEGFIAYNLHAGILGWIHDGQPVVSFTGETKRVHVFASQWNVAPEDYDTVW